METNTALQEYKQTGLITEKAAMDIIRTIPGWANAPSNVVKRTALLCKDYRLYPGVHIFLIVFNAGKTNESWAPVFGINATRLLATRRKPYKYIDGPRVVSEEEAKAHFRDDYDSNNLYAYCKLEGVDGSMADGWGLWPRADAPYGANKGNTRVNMAEIRAERRALNRLCPGEMPTGIDVLDESFVTVGQPEATIIEVVKATGEIVSAEATEVPTVEAQAEFSEETPAPDPAPGESPGPAPADSPKPTPSSKKMGKDPASFNPKNTADLVGGAAYYFQMKSDEVAALLGGVLPADPDSLADAWQVILGSKMKGEN